MFVGLKPYSDLAEYGGRQECGPEIVRLQSVGVTWSWSVRGPVTPLFQIFLTNTNCLLHQVNSRDHNIPNMELFFFSAARDVVLEVPFHPTRPRSLIHDKCQITQAIFPCGERVERL